MPGVDGAVGEHDTGHLDPKPSVVGVGEVDSVVQYGVVYGRPEYLRALLGPESAER